MDFRKLKVGTKLQYGGAVREVLSLYEENGTIFLTYAHQGSPVAGRIEARLFSPGAQIIDESV